MSSSEGGPSATATGVDGCDPAGVTSNTSDRLEGTRPAGAARVSSGNGRDLNRGIRLGRGF